VARVITEPGPQYADSARTWQGIAEPRPEVREGFQLQLRRLVIAALHSRQRWLLGLLRRCYVIVVALCAGGLRFAPGVGALAGVVTEAGGERVHVNRVLRSGSGLIQQDDRLDTADEILAGEEIATA